MLSRDDLFRALRHGDKQTSVGKIVRLDCPIASQTELLGGVFRRMQEEGCSALPVVADNQLVGSITLENIGELVMLSQSRQRLPGTSPGDAVV
jgi:predicted transcriptional regulator